MEEGKVNFSSKKVIWYLFVKGLKQGKSQTAALLAVMSGVGFGFILSGKVSDYLRQYIDLPGEFMMNTLQTISVPLVVPNIITGVASMTVKASRRIALRIFVFVIVTNILSLAVGFLLVEYLRPGKSHAKKKAELVQTNIQAVFIVRDIIINLIPRNIIISAMAKYKTEYEKVIKNGKEVYEHWEVLATGSNVIGLIVWSVLSGILIDTTITSGHVTVECFAIIGEATKHIISYVSSYIPFAAFFMMLSTVSGVEDWHDFTNLGYFFFLLGVAFALMAFVILPLLYFACTKCNPYPIIKGVYPALLTAFFLSSSSATLPQTLRCCEHNLKIDKRVTRFMIPIVTTMSMNGSTIMDVFAACFITQMNAIMLSVSHMAALVLLSLSTTFGESGIPSVGMATTYFILSAAGLPIDNIPLLVPFEWIMDRFATVLNVYSDCIGVSLIEKLSKGELTEGAMSLMSISSSDFDGDHYDALHHISSELDALQHSSAEYDALGNESDFHTAYEYMPI